jgi:hypothetical protein
MKTRWINSGISSIVALAFVFVAAPDAFASKENFERDKPHVNAAEEEKEEAGTKVRKPMQDVKSSAATDEQKAKKHKKHKKHAKHDKHDKHDKHKKDAEERAEDAEK